MSDLIKKTAKAAGKWWADLLCEEQADKREAFAAAVARLTAQEMRGECYWDWWGERKDGVGWEGNRSWSAEFDYDPHGLLIPAFAEIIGEPSFKWKRMMPTKHYLHCSPGVLEPKAGYGNRLEPIKIVPASDGAHRAKSASN